MHLERAQDFDPEAFGRRLRDEIKRRGMPRSAFCNAVEERVGPEMKGKGGSYGNVRSYVMGEGSAAPRLFLIDVMWNVLCESEPIRKEYFWRGTGGRTEEEEEARRRNRAFIEQIQTTRFESGWERSSLYALTQELGIDGYPFFLAGLRLGLPELDELQDDPDHAIYLMRRGWEGFERFLLGPLRQLCPLNGPSTPRARSIWSSYLRTALLAVEMALDARDEELGRGERKEAQLQTAHYLAYLGQLGDDAYLKKVAKTILAGLD